MTRLIPRTILLLNVIALSGCVASMAASAVSMAVSSARGAPHDNQGLQPAAAKSCDQKATSYGTVHIIDVEQHSSSRIIVWGTVDNGKIRRSFECDYGTKVDGFKLRPIPSRAD